MTRILSAAALALLILPLGAAAPEPQRKYELRCGWLHNPTPANWWLDDRDGQWIIGSQGGFQAEGIDRIPDPPESMWVVTNGTSYGHGCACLSVLTNKREHRITHISSGRARPLAACRNDKALRPPID